MTTGHAIHLGCCVVTGDEIGGETGGDGYEAGRLAAMELARLTGEAGGTGGHDDAVVGGE